VQLPSKRVDYVIDSAGRRIGKRVGGTLSRGFLYDARNRVVAELDSSGTVVSQFVYGSRRNVPDLMLRGGKTYRLVSDYLGSVRLVVDTSTSSVAQQIDYDTWGNVTNDTSPGLQPFGFAGGLYDTDTGLVRFGARDYEPMIGRWLSKDPILFGGRQGNLYVYVGDDPVNWTDPSGTAGVAIGLSVDFGLCWGICVGSWSFSAGTYLGTEGFGAYGSGQGGAGAGAHAGIGLQGSAYTDLAAFQGWSGGANALLGAGVIGSGSLMGNTSGAVLSLAGGVGGGIYAGVAASKTGTYGLSWDDIGDA
jgi:RHS repeat-associated protein